MHRIFTWEGRGKRRDRVEPIHRGAQASTDVDVLGARKLPTGQRRGPFDAGGALWARRGGGNAEKTEGEERSQRGRSFGAEHRHRLMSMFLGRGNSRQPSGGAIRRGGCPLGPETRRARRKRGENQTEKRLNRRRGSPKRNEVRKGRRGSGVPGETRSGEGEEPGGRRGREGWEGVETAAAGGYQLAGAGVRAGGRRRPRCWRGRPSLPAGRAID